MHMHSNQQGITEEEIMQMRKTKVVKLLQLYKLQYFRLQVRFLMINVSYGLRCVLRWTKGSRSRRTTYNLHTNCTIKS